MFINLHQHTQMFDPEPYAWGIIKNISLTGNWCLCIHGIQPSWSLLKFNVTSIFWMCTSYPEFKKIIIYKVNRFYIGIYSIKNTHKTEVILKNKK